MNDIEKESYYLISGKSIEEIYSKIVTLDKAAQFMSNEGFKSFSESLTSYGIEINSILKTAEKCDVVPRSKLY